MSAIWIKKKGRLWITNSKWSDLITVYEYHVPVRGLTVWAHHLLLKVGETKQWVISESSTGLRINTYGAESRAVALSQAIKKMEAYTDEQLAETIQNEVIKQVTHQIQGDTK